MSVLPRFVSCVECVSDLLIKCSYFDVDVVLLVFVCVLCLHLLCMYRVLLCVFFVVLLLLFCCWFRVVCCCLCVVRVLLLFVWCINCVSALVCHCSCFVVEFLACVVICVLRVYFYLLYLVFRLCLLCCLDCYCVGVGFWLFVCLRVVRVLPRFGIVCVVCVSFVVCYCSCIVVEFVVFGVCLCVMIVCRMFVSCVYSVSALLCYCSCIVVEFMLFVFVCVLCVYPFVLYIVCNIWVIRCYVCILCVICD